jgi:hypothetical protein
MWELALQTAPSNSAAAQHAFERFSKKATSDQRPDRILARFYRKIEQTTNLVTREAEFWHLHENQLDSGPHILYFRYLHPTLLPAHVWGNDWLR